MPELTQPLAKACSQEGPLHNQEMLQRMLISCVAAGGTAAGASRGAGQPPRGLQSGSPCSLVKPALSVSLSVTQQTI